MIEIVVIVEAITSRIVRWVYLDVVGDTMLFFSCTMSFISILCHFSFWAIKKGIVPAYDDASSIPFCN